MKTFMFFFVVLLIIGFLVFGGKNQIKTKQTVDITPTISQNQTQEQEKGGVTVKVTPKILKVGQKPAFDIEFNTHSVELDFDLTTQSHLKDDNGNLINESTWSGSPPGGHHRSGSLIFNAPLPKTKSIELILDLSSNDTRQFTWNL